MRQTVGRDKTVTGYVATEPQIVETQKGQMVAFRLAEPKEVFDRESRQYKDVDPVYYDVAIRRPQLGQNVLASVEKGQRVSVTGNHAVEAYVDREGKPGLGNRVWAEEVAASMQHNTVQVKPGVEQAGADRGTGFERRGPEQLAGDPAWSAASQPVQQQFGVERGGPALWGPSR